MLASNIRAGQSFFANLFMLFLFLFHISFHLVAITHFNHSELEKFGMARDEVVRLVLTKTHSSLATLYYLLLDTLVTRRKTMKRPSSAAGVISSSAQVGQYRHKPSSSSSGPSGGGGGSSGNLAGMVTNTTQVSILLYSLCTIICAVSNRILFGGRLATGHRTFCCIIHNIFCILCVVDNEWCGRRAQGQARRRGRHSSHLTSRPARSIRHPGDARPATS